MLVPLGAPLQAVLASPGLCSCQLCLQLEQSSSWWHLAQGLHPVTCGLGDVVTVKGSWLSGTWGGGWVHPSCRESSEGHQMLESKDKQT